MSVIKRKVIAYVTRGSHLLVFKHIHFPEAGIQVPAGTIKDGEKAETAVLREVFEETGLENLYINRSLSNETINMRDYGKDEIHNRDFFHLICSQKTPANWIHIEKYPSEGNNTEIFFECFWVDLLDVYPQLTGGQGARLEQIQFPR